MITGVRTWSGFWVSFCFPFFILLIWLSGYYWQLGQQCLVWAISPAMSEWFCWRNIMLNSRMIIGSLASLSLSCLPRNWWLDNSAWLPPLLDFQVWLFWLWSINWKGLIWNFLCVELPLGSMIFTKHQYHPSSSVTLLVWSISCVNNLFIVNWIYSLLLLIMFAFTWLILTICCWSIFLSIPTFLLSAQPTGLPLMVTALHWPVGLLPMVAALHWMFIHFSRQILKHCISIQWHYWFFAC